MPHDLTTSSMNGFYMPAEFSEHNATWMLCQRELIFGV